MDGLSLNLDYIKGLLAYHAVHDMALGEFFNTTKDVEGLVVETGCFAQYKDRDANVVGISRIPPEWFDGWNWSVLAPSFELLQDYKSGVVDANGYCRRFYRETLSRLDAVDVHRSLLRMECPVLLCYENEGEFCHRHVVQEWLTVELVEKGIISL